MYVYGDGYRLLFDVLCQFIDHEEVGYPSNIPNIPNNPNNPL